MFQPLPLPCAVTQHGELVTAANIQQEDYDGLFCEHCHVRIEIVLDWHSPYGRLFYHSTTAEKSKYAAVSFRFIKICAIALSRPTYAKDSYSPKLPTSYCNLVKT